MLNQFSEYLVKAGLCQKTDHLLVAISGGVDSVVLADLLVKSGFKLTLAHVNFGLRGEASDGDEQHVRTLAEKWGVPVEVIQVNTKEVKKMKGGSTQMVARELRYTWFWELCAKHGAKLVTAHHRDDKVETFLLNLTRGTGIKGLTGMAYVQDGVHRPLLGVSKKELLDYAVQNHLEWREDQSNATDNYKRNLIRNKVLPLMEKLNPNVANTLVQVAKRLEETNKLLEYSVKAFKETWLQESSRIKIPLPSQLNAEVFYYALAEYGFSHASVLDMLQCIENKQVGKKIHAVSHELLLDRAALYLCAISQQEQVNVKLDWGKNAMPFGEVFVQKEEQIVSFKSAESRCQYFDLSALTGEICLRNWQEGDVFKPLGMKGKQKLSDFLINNKVPLSEKQKIVVLTINGKIAWVVGYRISEEFKVKKNKPTFSVRISNF